MKTNQVNEEVKPTGDGARSERQEHSLLPWAWLPDEGQFVVDAKQNIVAEIPCQGCNPHDGAFIVRAANAHDALYEAAKKAANELSVMLALNPARDGGLYREALDALNTALVLVDGPQGK